MRLVNRGLIVAMAAGALALPVGRPSTRTVDPRGADAAQAKYSPQSVERYLSTDQFIYVRPGFHITVNSVTIGSDNKPVMDLTFTDDAGQPLDRTGILTPGALSVSPVLAWYDPGTRNYTSYVNRIATAAPPSPNPGVTAVQATADSGGKWTDLAVGHSTYKFKNAVPAGFDGSKTTTLGIYATRNTTAIVGKNYFANVEFDFRPDGGAVTDKWGELDPQSASCNKCHDPLSAHGGSRQDVKLCVLCHNPGTTDPDTGNTVDMKVMIHKIHYGSSLPSVKAGTPYEIIGFQQGVNDFSTVVFPQDIRNCQTCHAPSATAPDSAEWMTSPSRAACGSCHDDINWTTGANHPAGAQADDGACSSCHLPSGDAEWDAGIATAHTVPVKSKQLKGLKATVVSVTNTAPGQTPTVQFQITNGDGSVVNPKDLGSGCNVLLDGPTTDYALFPVIRERADGAAFDGTTATYTFTKGIPADATGSWTVSMDVRRTVNLSPAPRQGPTSVREGAFNPIFDVAVTDATPQSRRVAVDINKCNVCHDKLAFHGGQRLNTQECVMCHNPNATASGEGIDFKRMIHRIHTGENLTQQFKIGNTSFNDVRFPGDRRDCLKCHASTDAYQVIAAEDAVAQGRIPTLAPSDFFSPQGPNAAACLGCHDTRTAAAHAFQMTAPFGESCEACHGTDADFAVDKVHAR